MKTNKIISIVVILLFVIALGIFLGKQAFTLFEASQTNTEGTQNASNNNTEVSNETSPSELAEINYGNTDKTPVTVPVMNTARTAPVIEERPSFGVDPFEQTIQENRIVTNSQTPQQNIPNITNIPNKDTQTVSSSVANIPQIQTDDPEVRQIIQSSQASVTPQTTQATQTAPTMQAVQSAQTPKTYVYANGNNINIRKGPSTSNKKLFQVNNNQKGTVIEKKNGWTHVLWEHNKKDGWVRDDLIKSDTVVSNTSQTASSNVNSNSTSKNKSAANQKQTPKNITENVIAIAVAQPANLAETTNTYIEGNKLPKEAIINAETYANIRALPNTTSEKVAKLPKGMIVSVTSVKKIDKWQWFEIVFQGGRKRGWTREDNIKFQ